MMNILLISNVEGTGLYPVRIANELSRLGNNVKLLSTGGDNPNWLFRRRYYQNRHQGRWGKLIINAQIHRAISQNNIDILLLISNWFLHPGALSLIKKRGIKVVLWEGDLAFNKSFQREAVPLYDLIVAGDTYILPFLVNVMGHHNVHYFKGHGIPSEFYRVEPTVDERRKYGADISFIGKYFPNRDGFFSGLGLPVKIWGNRWNLSKLPGADQIRPLPPENKRLVFCSSKINLNLRAGDQQVNNFSTRIFEVPLCGAFVLSEWSKDLVEFFEEDKEVVTFKSPAEAREKIEYFLKDESSRKNVIEAMRARIMKDYLLKDTVAKVNNQIQRLL